jgi:hypothetical protein
MARGEKIGGITYNAQLKQKAGKNWKGGMTFGH